MIRLYSRPVSAQLRLLERELEVAEARAWDALRRYKFQMFGYWAAIWVHLNRIGGFRRPNPWRALVHAARSTSAPVTSDGDNVAPALRDPHARGRYQDPESTAGRSRAREGQPEPACVGGVAGATTPEAGR